MTTLTERIEKLPKARRKKVEERAKALIAEEMSLQESRKARKKTHVRGSETCTSDVEAFHRRGG